MTNDLERERNLLVRLLDLGEQDEPEAFLREALAVCVARSGASRGYLALFADERDGGAPTWFAAEGFSDVELQAVSGAVSKGIIAAAIHRGHVVHTSNALVDPAWQGRASVRALALESVICAPVGNPPLGVLYLQGDADDLSREDEADVVRLARWIAPHAERLVARLRSKDPTKVAREALPLDGVVGRSDALALMLEEALVATRSRIPALLVGPSGSGKTVIARAIAAATQGSRTFEAHNCAHLSRDLLLAQLFGAAPGAFSGAPPEGLPGWVSAADGGTLFLDEVASLPADAQAALLTFLDNGEYRRLGETKVSHARVRILAATNVDLEAARKDGSFREDLYFRLSELVIRVPALEERRSDIPLIAERILQQDADANQEPYVPLSPAAAHALREADWPGNVRQLAGTLRGAAARARARALPRIGPAELFPGSRRPDVAPAWQDATRDFHQRLLLQSLNANEWNISEVSRQLDLGRSHVYRLIQAFGLARE